MIGKVRLKGTPIIKERVACGKTKLSTFVPLKIRKRGAKKVVIRPQTCATTGEVDSNFDQPLITALTRAFYWQQLIDDGVVVSGSDIAKREGLHHSTVNELLRLTLLDPTIIKSVLAGTQPRCMNLLWFQRNPLPVDWCKQRAVMEGFDG